jgi:hypothetical protein
MNKIIFAVSLFCMSHTCFAGWGVGNERCERFLNASSAFKKYVVEGKQFDNRLLSEEFEEWLMGYMTVFGEYMDNNPTDEYPIGAVRERIAFYCKDPSELYGVAVRKAIRDVYRPKQKLKKHVRESLNE